MGTPLACGRTPPKLASYEPSGAAHVNPNDPDEYSERASQVGWDQAGKDIGAGISQGMGLWLDGIRKNAPNADPSGGRQDSGVYVGTGVQQGSSGWKMLWTLFLVTLTLVGVLAAGFGLLVWFRSSMVVEITVQERQQAIAELTPHAKGLIQQPERLRDDLREYQYDHFRRRENPDQHIAALAIYALSEPYPKRLSTIPYVDLIGLKDAVEHLENTPGAQAVLETALDNREWGCQAPDC